MPTAALTSKLTTTSAVKIVTAATAAKKTPSTATSTFSSLILLANQPVSNSYRGSQLFL